MSIYENAMPDLPAGNPIRRKQEERIKKIRIQRRIANGLVLFAAGAAVFWGTRASLLKTPEVGKQFRAEQTKEVYSATKAVALEGTVQKNREQKADLLVLVNKDHALPDDYHATLHWLQNGSCAVAEDMYEALQDMLKAGSEEGLEFVVTSGYRDAGYQQRLLDADIQNKMQSEGVTWQQAYEKETQETMLPGYSEHETGLAVDIVARSYQILDEMQEMTPENKWLRVHCSEYGFILRYPKGKEEITGINYEAWHFRYVGENAAQEIAEKNITLEEYLEKK